MRGSPTAGDSEHVPLARGQQAAAQRELRQRLREPLRVFLERCLEGARISEIAEELGVSREWCSKAYRKQALAQAGMQFIRLTGQ